MGSSAQNSSGVHWCRRRVTFNRVPEKVPEKVPQKVWEALVQSQVRFNRVPEKVPGSLGGKPSQVQLGSGEGSGEGSGRLWCSTRSGSTGFRTRSGEGLGGFGAEPGQVQQGSGEGSGEGFRKPWQSQVQRGPEKVAEQVPEKVFGNLWCRARSGQGFQRLASQHASERFLKIKLCGCWGYHRSLYIFFYILLFYYILLHFITFYYILLHFITFYYILFTFYYILLHFITSYS